MAWKRKHTISAIARRPWKLVMYALAIVGFYDLVVAQFIPNPLVFPRIIEIPTRFGWSWQIWVIILLVALLILIFEGAHYHIRSFEKERLGRIHVELWGYGTYLLSSPLEKIGDCAHNLSLTVTNQSESIPLGIARFYIVVEGRTQMPIAPIHPDQVREFTVFGGKKPFRDDEPIPHDLYLKPKESRTGQLLFVHDGEMNQQRLYIVDETGTSWTIKIDGSTLLKMGKRRAENIRELC